MVNDPVGDFIARIMNGSAIRKASVSIPFSNLKMSIAEKLKETGHVVSVDKKGKKVRKTLDITLKYDESGVSAIRGAKRVSKPGRRVYKRAQEITPVRGGRGVLFLSTPQGIKTGAEARKEHIGGEALFEIW
ncbi:MAG: 30S ribosomal protein S8, partial [bacterium]|nr:30S ribosomal protein S8 [bacterium]